MNYELLNLRNLPSWYIVMKNLYYLVCSPTSKCKEGKGHCNIDNDCKEGLKCGRKNCIKDDSKNCCYRPNGEFFKNFGYEMDKIIN